MSAAVIVPRIGVIALAAFITVFSARYIRTVVSIGTFYFYKPKPVLENPKYIVKDASIIIPTTFKKPGELLECVERISNEGPGAIYIVTADQNVSIVQQMLQETNLGDVRVLGVEHLNKRAQLLKALRDVETSIVVFADDDVFWPAGYLPRLLAIFEDDKVGAGGTRQRVRRDKADMWNFLGIAYLERRVWNNISTNAIDGSISTLSGRTAAYRTKILQTPKFFTHFNGDTWRGKPLNSDDDKCLTRWVYSNGWNICIQSDPESVLETTVEGDSKYLDQCMRWARAHWRGNFTVMEQESYWCSVKFFWGLYIIYFVGETPFAIDAYICFAIWIIFTKVVKLIPHFCRHPTDMRFIPLMILFSYYHGFMNIYAMGSMMNTFWGSQNLKQLETIRTIDAESLIQTAINEAEEHGEHIDAEEHVNIGDHTDAEDLIDATVPLGAEVAVGAEVAGEAGVAVGPEAAVPAGIAVGAKVPVGGDEHVGAAQQNDPAQVADESSTLQTAQTGEVNIDHVDDSLPALDTQSDTTPPSSPMYTNPPVYEPHRPDLSLRRFSHKPIWVNLDGPIDTSEPEESVDTCKPVDSAYTSEPEDSTDTAAPNDLANASQPEDSAHTSEPGVSTDTDEPENSAHTSSFEAQDRPQVVPQVVEPIFNVHNLYRRRGGRSEYPGKDCKGDYP
ncbi:hypothetical protein TI39_contig419g00018 [Zymoseptoria brevis]|uniref:Glycosyltransferase family 2 protein n=1 Tax=Zymoseptoria brevis TaxID=1047168 RepID=A0A0F4GLJ1_9PEZI|nr:hypothetical protein TI39_contig419g00018 [Zymoseptoria brevis]